MKPLHKQINNNINNNSNSNINIRNNHNHNNHNMMMRDKFKHLNTCKICHQDKFTNTNGTTSL